jgi:acyl-coenzyme A thioesterase PaaI-like protein
MYQPQARGRILPTISLQLDYLTAAPLGAWVEGRAEILRTTRSMIFSQGLVTVDGDPAVRISCISKIGPIVGDGQNSDPLRILGEA